MTAEAPLDVVLVGGGIMSATLATLIHELEPDWSIEILERLPGVAQESSNAWNNAGTGHSALCELNYSPERADGSIDITSAVRVNEQFQVSRQFWASLVREGVIADPTSFITPTPHMAFVRGEKDVDYLRRRHEALRNHPLFHGVRFTEDRAQIAAWAPLIMKGRDRREPVAATYSDAGTDVDFGSLTRQLVARLEQQGIRVRYEHEVTKIRRSKGAWSISSVTPGRYAHRRSARFVFVGAGGGALRLLQSSRIREIRGFAGFPVSGRFFRATDPTLVGQHRAKVYGKAGVGAPPMSVPHLDTRVVDGSASLLFGPYAGFSPKFQKNGSLLDLVSTIRLGNLWPMIWVGLTNLSLVGYLFRELTASRRRQLAALAEFLPTVDGKDWELITAGQRVQVIKRRGATSVLQFGTEVVSAADGSIAGLLGASPGASTAAPIMLTVLERCFPQKIEEWTPRLRELVPSYGTALSADADTAERILADTAAVLHLDVRG